MKIRFTLTLSKKAVKAFKAEGLEEADDVKDNLVDILQEHIAEIKEAHEGEDDDE